MAEAAEGQKLLDIKNTAMSTTSLSSATAATQRRSQQSRLAGIVKRKSTDKGETVEKRRKLSGTDTTTETTEEDPNDSVGEPNAEPSQAAIQTSEYATGITCLGVLPGLGIYSDSSDSEASSDSDIDPAAGQYDLLGRPRWHNHVHPEAAAQNSSKA